MTEPMPEDFEALVRDEPAGSKMELRLWLRLLSVFEPRQRRDPPPAASGVRRDIAPLRRPCAVEPRAGRASPGRPVRRMMVSNGNITGLIDRLVEEGLVVRKVDPNDRRAATVG